MHYGQLGDGGTGGEHIPVWVDLGTDRTAVAITAGYSTPAPFLTTVQFPVGDGEILGN